MVNYLVFSLASISILATAFPLPGHVPEITYRLFGQLPRLAARSTSFLFLFSPSPVAFSVCFHRPPSFFSFFPFVGPFAGEVSFWLVLLCSFRKRCTPSRITWEILNFRTACPSFLFRFLPFFARFFGLKRYDCWLFLSCLWSSTKGLSLREHLLLEQNVRDSSRYFVKIHG